MCSIADIVFLREFQVNKTMYKVNKTMFKVNKTMYTV